MTISIERSKDMNMRKIRNTIKIIKFVIGIVMAVALLWLPFILGYALGIN